MISTVRVYRPALGKQAALRALLTESVRTRQSDGADTNLQQQIYSSQGPAFTSTTWHEDVAAMDARRKAVEGSQEFGRFQERLSGLLASPQTVRIYETVVQVPRTGGHLAAGGIVVRRFWTPAVGRMGAAERVLREAVQQWQNEGHRIGLSRRIMQDEAPYLVTTNLHPDMADYSAGMDAIRNSEGIRAFFEQINPLLATPQVVRFFEVLVPRPAR